MRLLWKFKKSPVTDEHYFVCHYKDICFIIGLDKQLWVDNGIISMKLTDKPEEFMQKIISTLELTK